MKTPASVWAPSAKRYDPHPARWEYPTGAWVLKVDCQGKLEIKRRKWTISQALAGERVQVVPVHGRWMIFYCATLVRELDPRIQCSTIVEHWIPTPTPAPQL